MLEIKGLQKFYNERLALDIRHLRLEKGKIYALIGPNGCGKSTLLRIIAGTLMPEAGELRFSEPLEPRDIAYMPQKTYAFRCSVLKNVLLAGQGLDKERAVALARQSLLEVGLAELERRRADTLSGGEAQRMAFARMIMRPRKLLLLDEPTSATDIAGNDLVEEVLLRFTRQSGCTVLFSTHSPAQALRLANEVIALHQGQLAEQGEARKLLTTPRDPEVAKFLRHWRIDQENFSNKISEIPY